MVQKRLLEKLPLIKKEIEPAVYGFLLALYRIKLKLKGKEKAKENE